MLGDLLAPLNKEKASLMKNLLESVQTPKLKSAFDKYLPAVLNQGSVSQTVANKQSLTESKMISEVTGDKAAKKITEEDEDQSNLIDFKRLAGL